MYDWLKKNVGYISEGFMKNIGTALAIFILSGGYLIALNTLTDFQTWVRSIPTDYILTPFILLLIASGALLREFILQKRTIEKIAEQPKITDEKFRFVTHFGVWWKIDLNANYFEDFPYCPCCDSPRKLVQTHWHPEEKFKCPTTGTEVQLIDGYPLTLENVRNDLYEAYFGGDYISRLFSSEFIRLKDLHPEEDVASLLRNVFQAPPFHRFPHAETEKILNRFKTAHDVAIFLTRNATFYRNLLREKEK